MLLSELCCKCLAQPLKFYLSKRTKSSKGIYFDRACRVEQKKVSFYCKHDKKVYLKLTATSKVIHNCTEQGRKVQHETQHIMLV